MPERPRRLTPADVRRRFGNGSSEWAQVLRHVCHRLGVAAEKLDSDLEIPANRVGDIVQKLRELGLVTQLQYESEPWLLPTDAGRRFYRRHLSHDSQPITVPVFSVELDLAKKDPTAIAARLTETLEAYEQPTYYG